MQLEILGKILVFKRETTTKAKLKRKFRPELRWKANILKKHMPSFLLLISYKIKTGSKTEIIQITLLRNMQCNEVEEI